MPPGTNSSLYYYRGDLMPPGTIASLYYYRGDLVPPGTIASLYKYTINREDLVLLALNLPYSIIGEN